jgi:uncharacterized metal-binding protein (TIGR02443 family)
LPTSTSRRRFIAGAVCPRCALMDRIVVDLDTDRRECVACGFTEARPADKPPGEGGQGTARPPANAAGDPGRELPTRVSRAAARRVETVAEPVKLIDPAKK